MQRSEKQLAASRANGAKSKGATTPVGQRISSRNKRPTPLSSAVPIHGESRRLFNTLIDAYRAEFQPPSSPDKILSRPWTVAGDASRLPGHLSPTPSTPKLETTTKITKRTWISINHIESKCCKEIKNVSRALVRSQALGHPLGPRP